MENFWLLSLQLSNLLYRKEDVEWLRNKKELIDNIRTELKQIIKLLDCLEETSNVTIPEDIQENMDDDMNAWRKAQDIDNIF